MERPLANKRPVGPFVKSSRSVDSGATITFILSGVADGANVLGGIEDTAVTTDIVNESLFNLGIKPEEVDVTRQPPNTEVLIKLKRPESHQRINDLVSEMESIYEVDGIIIGGQV